MKIEKTSHEETYRVENDFSEFVTVTVEVIKKKMTIWTNIKNLNFIFSDCDPEKTMRIGELIMEAANIANGAILNVEEMK